MTHLRTLLVPQLMAIVCASSATAGSSSVGVTVTSDRVQNDLTLPKSTQIEVDAAHAFDSGAILGTSLEYSDAAFGDSDKLNLEGTFGYRMRFNDVFSMTASAGLGEQYQSSGRNFPYYVLRAFADLEVNKAVTWNAIAFRFRDAFDPDDDYLTPQLATGATFKINEHDSIAATIAYNWKDWEPDSIGVSLGYKFGF
jgi:Outer membrane protein beta-barrel domain